MTRFTDRQPPSPPSDPLDEEERALARVLRGLPSAVPPPELDARILGASRRAIAIAPKAHAHRRGWVWGLSTAAAAVLAVGVLLKMHLQGRDQPIAPPSEAPAAAEPVASPTEINTAANATDAAAAAAGTGLTQSAVADSESKAADQRAPDVAAANAIGKMQEAAKSERDEMKAAKPTAPPSSASGTVAQLEKPAARQAAASNAAPQPFPAAPAAAHAATPEREAGGAFAKTAAADQPGYLSAPAPPPPPPPPLTTAISQPRPAPVPPPPEPAQMQESQNASDARKDAALDRVEVTGSRLKRAAESAQLPPIDDDAKLSPSQWLARIRARANAADGAGARESLHRFIARYPDWAVPADLAPLR